MAPGKKGSSSKQSLSTTTADVSTASETHTMDVLTKMFTFMEQRDEERKRQEEQQRQEDRHLRQLEFKTLIESITSVSKVTSTPTGSGESDPTTTPCPPGIPSFSSVVENKPKVEIRLPKPLNVDVSFRQFSEWKQQFLDYCSMVDLFDYPNNKQLIQLRSCLSLEMNRLLEHNLGIPPDSSMPLADVLTKIETYVKGQHNEALRRLAFTKCKQAENESFTDFFVRLQQLSEEVDLCKGTHCVDAQMKHAILVGIRSEDLMKKLISMPSSASLQEVKTTCMSFEAAKSTTNELRNPKSSVCAVSNYKKQKKAANQPVKNYNHLQQKTPASGNRCDRCGQQHDKGSCKAASNKCRNCGKTGHYPFTAVCPALAKECRICHKYGHFDICCARNKPKQSKPK